jgi:hypothetical protein
MDREAALAVFIRQRGEEGTSRYEEMFRRNFDLVERLFKWTNDLLDLTGATFELDPTLVSPARYITAPPTSEDDLNTLAGGRVTGRRRITLDLAARAADVVKAACDPIRFPWVDELREPTRTERRTALMWTAGVWAIESLRTLRRGESSRQQEAAVVLGLDGIGWRMSDLRQISTLDDLPRGDYSREALLARSKCDIPIRLKDGRLLALECKVSNSEINSVKRLNREVGGKADQWRGAFGEQVIPGAVLSGVFKLRNLVEAQDRQRIAIFWEHDLDALLNFVASCE